MAAGNFDACMPFIFREEGGFTKDPHDPGNWTLAVAFAEAGAATK